MINLEKGGKVLLEKSNDSGTELKTIVIGLGWDAKQGSASGSEFDLDASLVAVGDDGKVYNGGNGFCFYNKLTILDGAIKHSGDNLTGDGDGDDEAITIKLDKLPSAVKELILVVNIYDAKNRNQNFGMADNSYIRLLNANDGDKELIHFDLNFDASTATGVKFAKLFRKGDSWAFSADQVEFEGGLETIKTEYRIN